MVDFRYHLVTIIAIFLALALGVVVGTTTLNGQVLDDLNGRVKNLASDKRGLESDLRKARAQTDADQALVAQLTAKSVDGVLAGERVVILTTPNAPRALRSSLIPVLKEAGATISTQVALRPDLVDPTKQDVVQQVTEKAATPGVDRTGAAIDVAARQITAALLLPKKTGPAGLTDGQAASTLAAFTKSDLVDVDGKVEPRGTLAVLLTGEAVVSAEPSGVQARVSALLTLAAAMDRGSAGLVISGPPTAVDAGGLIQALRTTPLKDVVSSVDDVDRPQGRVATVYALLEQDGGDAGQYGTGSGSDGPLPSGGG